ncbi:MAG: membrane protein insertase YidC [Chitinispirillaceae bacterium]
MNKNSILAFLLIGVAVIFFNSSFWNNFWYETVLNKPVPTTEKTVTQKSQEKEHKPEEKSVTKEQSISSQDSSEKNAESVEDTADAVKKIQKEDSVIVETDRYIATVSTKGGRIISLRMKNYEYNGDKKGQMIDIVPEGSEGGAQLSINNKSFNETIFSTSADTAKPVKVGEKAYNLEMETKDSRGNTVRKIFTFSNDSYKIGYTVQGESLKDKKVVLGWNGGIEESESGSKGRMAAMTQKRRVHYSDGSTVQHMEMIKEQTEDPSGRFRWVGMSSKYFFISVVSEQLTDADLVIKGYNVSSEAGKKDREINYSVSFQKMAESDKVEGWIYAGPSEAEELSRYDLKFDKIMFPVLSWARYVLWSDAWFPPIAEIILKGLLFLYGLVKDYGIAILLLTFLTKVITYPMTHSSTKSMNRLKEIQPKINALKQKYKNNPQKLQQEQMALFKKEGVNPFNPGCLPMFLQMPIFIALFVVLRKAVELRGASSFILPWIKDLSQPEALFTLPGNGLPLYGANVALLPIIMAVMTFLQQKMTIKDPNQKAMVYFMPLIMLIMFNGFPAGVVFYWTLSSAFSLLQQWLMNKKNESTTPVTAEISSARGSRKAVAKK